MAERGGFSASFINVEAGFGGLRLVFRVGLRGVFADSCGFLRVLAGFLYQVCIMEFEVER